jgi:hypothetical protein
MEALPKININTGAAGKADVQQSDSGTSAGGPSFADLLTSAHGTASGSASRDSFGRSSAERGAKPASGGTTEIDNHGNSVAARGTTERGATPTAKTVRGATGAVARDAKDAAGEATDGTAADRSGATPAVAGAGSFAAGLAGAMLNTVAPTLANATATPTTDAVLGGAAAGLGAKPLPGTQTAAGGQTQPAAGQGAGTTQNAAGDAAATGKVADAASAAAQKTFGGKADAFANALANAAGGAAGTKGAAAAKGATELAQSAANAGEKPAAANGAAATPAAGATATSDANLLLTTDDSADDPAAVAAAAAAAGAGKSTPGKANSLVTGSSDVVTAKAAIRTNAVDPTTTVKDAKPAGTAASGTAAGASAAANQTLSNPADATASRTAPAHATASSAGTTAQTATEAVPARTDHSTDAARVDAAATTPSSAVAADSTATANPAGAATPGTTVTAADQSATAQHANTAGGARATPSPAPVFDQIAISVNRAASDGLDRITIQLKPESLGRVDVHLQLGHDGRMAATFVADRQDTLDMLQRDSRGLERALNDAGLRTDSGGLSFNLRGDGRDYSGLARDMAQGAQNGAPAGTADTQSTAEATRPARLGTGLLDISV